MILLKNEVAPTPENFVRAERGLLEQTGTSRAFWAGRAGTMLTFAYRLAAQRKPHINQPEVIVPAMMCVTAANVAHISGLVPRFADVDPHTGLMSLETIQQRHTEKTVAVVVIHLLGHTVDMEPIAAWCKAHDMLLIEDPTQALGGHYPDGRFTGSIGDVALYSFNRTKIIGAGNGVLAVRDEADAEAIQTMMESDHQLLSSYDPALQAQLALSYRNLHHGLAGLLRTGKTPVEKVSEAFLALRPAYETLYLRPVDPDVDLNAAWEDLPASLARRLGLARLYAAALADSKWELLTDFEQSGVCWRFSLLLDDPGQQVAFSEAVRRDGFHVSNLYWPAHHFFNPADACLGADAFGRRIVNLWVDHSVDADFVRRCCESLLRHA